MKIPFLPFYVFYAPKKLKEGWWDLLTRDDQTQKNLVVQAGRMLYKYVFSEFILGYSPAAMRKSILSYVKGKRF